MKEESVAKKKRFASYERTSVVRVEKVTHTVRIRLNARKVDVMDALKKVPDGAVVAMIIDDSDTGGYGEVMFEETIHIQDRPSKILKESV